MTGCRIGKVTLKEGGASVYKFPDRDLTVHDSAWDCSALKRANELVRDGTAKMVAVCVIKTDDSLMATFSKKDGVGAAEVLGSIEYLRTTAMDWWKE